MGSDPDGAALRGRRGWDGEAGAAEAAGYPSERAENAPAHDGRNAQPLTPKMLTPVLTPGGVQERGSSKGKRKRLERENG